MRIYNWFDGFKYDFEIIIFIKLLIIVIKEVRYTLLSFDQLLRIFYFNIEICKPHGVL